MALFKAADSALQLHQHSKHPLNVEILHNPQNYDTAKLYPYHCPRTHCPTYDEVCTSNLCKQLLLNRDKELAQAGGAAWSTYQRLVDEWKTLLIIVGDYWPGTEICDITGDEIDISTTESTKDTAKIRSCCTSCNAECNRLLLNGLNIRIALQKEKVEGIKEYMKLREQGEDLEAAYFEETIQLQDQLEREAELDGGGH